MPAPDSRSPSTSSYAVGLCGGSGIVYGIRLVAALLESGATVHAVATKAALRVIAVEQGLDLAKLGGLQGLWPGATNLHVHDLAAVAAAPASGSAGIRATILCPCSMGTLARVAHGFSSNLVERMADVAIKEGRPLVVVPRETPLSVIHLRNMLSLAQANVIVLPAMPGFYHRPQNIDDLVDFVVGKILDRLGVQSSRIRRWQTPPKLETSPWDEDET